MAAIKSSSFGAGIMALMGSLLKDVVKSITFERA